MGSINSLAESNLSKVSNQLEFLDFKTKNRHKRLSHQRDPKVVDWNRFSLSKKMFSISEFVRIAKPTKPKSKVKVTTKAKD